METALAVINLNSSTEQEIRDAVYASKEVTAHMHKLNYQGMIVAGYVIEDPTNGTGAYKIASGEDGSHLIVPIMMSIIIAALSILFAINGVGFFAGLWVLLPFIAVNYILKTYILKLTKEEQILTSALEVLLITMFMPVLGTAILGMDVLIEVVLFYLGYSNS